ncbi:MAG: hypothetical protein AAB227_07905 [Pseudomonadota bacterium]
MNSRILSLLAIATALSGCATYYKEPSSSSPRAQIAGKQKDCIIGCKGGVFIQAVNGVQVSNMWKSNNYYLNPGPNSVLVAISDAGLFGVCELSFSAVSGESYLATHVIEGTAFVVTTRDKAASEVANCVAPMGRAPSTSYMPIFIPVQ